MARRPLPVPLQRPRAGRAWALAAAATVSLASVLAGAVVPAAAQPAAVRPDPHNYAALGRTCRSELGRFCPEIGPGRFHDMALCLRPFASSLSLGCRAALRNTRSGSG